MMRSVKAGKKKWITRYDKELERVFFFYATVVMAAIGFILHCLQR